jgi:hypothetical protein
MRSVISPSSQATRTVNASAIGKVAQGDIP